jgi:hypothetical protein
VAVPLFAELSLDRIKQGTIDDSRLADFGAMLPAQTIDLGSTARLPGDYVAGHALGTSYTLDVLPPEATLRTD